MLDYIYKKESAIKNTLVNCVNIEMDENAILIRIYLISSHTLTSDIEYILPQCLCEDSITRVSQIAIDVKYRFYSPETSNFVLDEIIESLKKHDVNYYMVPSISAWITTAEN